MSDSTEVVYIDTTLRDGSHALDHEFTAEQCRTIVGRLVGAGVTHVEVGHGAGIGGSTMLMGLGATPNTELFRAAADVRGDAEILALVVPGFAVMDEIREAVDCGITGVRVATHATEADVGLQHLALGRELGLVTHGFLMMVHMAEPAQVAEQARMMEEAGAQAVTLADSAGYLVPDGYVARIEAVVGAVSSATVGVHTHNNLGLAMGNSLAGLTAGARIVDGSVGGLGAGAGNTAAEALAVALERAGWSAGIDAFALIDLAEEVVQPLMKTPQVMDGTSVVIGMSGVYSSFLRKAQAVGERYGVDPRVLLIAAGERRAVGGQEDLLEQLALEATRAGVAATR